MSRSLALERHCSLESRGPQVLGYLEGTTQAGGVDAGLRCLLDDPANDDGQLGGPVEHQHPVVGQQDRGDAGGDRGPDMGHSFIGAPRPVTGHRYPARQPEHGQGFYPTSDGAVGYRIGRCVRGMSVQHAAHVGAVGVHCRVHGDHRALDRRQVTFQEGPSRPIRTTADEAWFLRDGPAVKYISCAPGTRRLTLPWPFAEMAPLATTRWATSITWSTKSLSINPPFPAVDDDRAQG